MSRTRWMSVGCRDFTAVATACSLLALPSPASAGRQESPAPEDSDALVRAQQLVNSAQILYDEGKYEAAAETYKAAYNLEQNPLLLFNIAICYDRSNRFDEALDYLERYAAQAPESERAELERRRRSLQVRASNKKEPAPQVPAPQPSTSGEAQVPPSSDTSNQDAPSAPGPIFGVAGGVLTGVTVAALGLGAGFGAASLSERGKAEEACAGADGDLVCFEDAKARQKRQTTYGLVADVSFGVAAAAGIALITVLAVRAARRRRARTAWSPAVGAGEVGFTVVHRF